MYRRSLLIIVWTCAGARGCEVCFLSGSVNPAGRGLGVSLIELGRNLLSLLPFSNCNTIKCIVSFVPTRS